MKEHLVFLLVETQGFLGSLVGHNVERVLKDDALQFSTPRIILDDGGSYSALF